MKTFFKYWLPVLLWAGVIFFFASLPGAVLPEILFFQDILFHILEYALLALLLTRALKNSRIKFFSSWQRVILVILSCLIYAILDELYQGCIPGRVSAISDVISDGLGIVIGSAIYQMKPRFSERQ
jgi:VanZ family protein